MKKNLTEIVFILDRSGSMQGLEKDTIGGFNAMLKQQKEVEGEALVSTVLFDHETLVLHDRIPIKEVADLTDKDYSVRGCTALIDAIGESVKHIQTIHKYIREEDVPEKTIFIITTDGMENASRKYTAEQVRNMIRQQEEKGWEFIFMGANIDAVQTAKHFGIQEAMAVNYVNDCAGVQANFAGASEAIKSVRATGKVGKTWRTSIDSHYKNKKGR